MLSHCAPFQHSENIEGQRHTVKPHDLEEPQRRRLWTLQKPQKKAEEEEKSVCFSGS